MKTVSHCPAVRTGVFLRAKRRSRTLNSRLRASERALDYSEEDGTFTFPGRFNVRKFWVLSASDIEKAGPTSSAGVGISLPL
jgi:hypothetical protein